MTYTLTDPNTAEQLSVDYSDNYAQLRKWKFDELKEPVEDLEIFFRHLPGNRILDIGCGWARYVYRFIDHGLQYTDIDHSPEMVAAAKEAYPDEQFELISYREVGFSGNSFDALWCCCSFGSEPKHNMPSVLEGLKQILVPGGVMMVVMPAVYDSHEQMMTDDDGNPLLHNSHYELSELALLLKASGFSIIEATEHYNHGAMSVLVKK